MSKIKHEVEKCIGCGSCAALCPKYFEMIDNGKAHLIGSANQDPEGTPEELEVEKVECAQAAAEACPAQCIHIE